MSRLALACVLLSFGCSKAPFPEPETEHPVERAEEERRLQARLDDLKAVFQEAAAESGVTVIAGIELRGSTSVFTVPDSYHYQPYQMRLQAAQTMQRAWARWAYPYEPRKARIIVQDRLGNVVGGSNPDDAEKVWVQER